MPDHEATEHNAWAKLGALVVADGVIPAGNKRPVIVCETRTDGGKLDKDRKYPAKADIYYRTPGGADFGDHEPVVELGRDVQQGLTAGFSDHPDYVNVGPASPVYAAVNLAYIRGAREIEVIGLTDAQKAHLGPWFDIVWKGGPMQGANSVTHTIPPNSVKIVLT